MMKPRFYWPNMDKTIKGLCAACTSCQQVKIYKHTKSPVETLEIPSARFHMVHIVIVGPLFPAKSSNNPYISPYQYLLTCMNQTSHWIEAQPMSEITAPNMAEAFVNVWITHFGVSLHVITDKGTQFESKLFSELLKIIGFYLLHTTAYHPQCNSLIERAHRTIKTAIIVKKESWISALPIILLGIQSMPNCSGFSPFYAVNTTVSHRYYK